MHSLIPKLRFLGFSDEWQIKKIGDLADVKGGKRMPKGHSLQVENNGLPYITVSDMENGSVSFSKIRYVPESVKNVIKNYKISVDDIYISVAGTLGLVGSIPKELDGANLTENANKLTNIKCDRTYLLQFLKSNRFAKLVKNVQTANAQPKLAIYAIKSFPVSVPGKDEQEKIAGFFGVVDKKVGRLQKKIELLEKYKKVIMQKIFTKAIRFNNEVWEKVPLKELVSIPISDGPHLTPTFVKTGILFLSVDNLQEGIVKIKNPRRISKEDHEEYAKKCRPQNGDILFGKAASVGNVAIANLGEEFNVWSPIAILRINHNIANTSLVYYALQTKDLKKQVCRYINSSSQENIGMSDLNKLEISLPKLEEQQKIANFLTAIDDKINLTKKELEQAKIFKKALLQQMLV